MALLTALMGFPVFTKDKIFLEQLPLSYSSVGTAGPAPSSTYVDAQGCPLDVATTRIATLQFGDVAFKEKFIIADVTTPLVALGHIIRSGWSLVQSELGPCLVKGDHSIQVLYKNNSLFSLVAPKSNVWEMINLQLREVILLVSEPRRHRGLRKLQINNKCFK